MHMSTSAEVRPRSGSVAELTVRAVAAGLVFGLLFGAANAYLGLRVGFTIATSIPVAVMTVALPRIFGAKVSILEANLAQTIGSASTSLATGAIFTLPALWLWMSPPGYLQIADWYGERGDTVAHDRYTAAAINIINKYRNFKPTQLYESILLGRPVEASATLATQNR